MESVVSFQKIDADRFEQNRVVSKSSLKGLKIIRKEPFIEVKQYREVQSNSLNNTLLPELLKNKSAVNKDVEEKKHKIKMQNLNGRYI